MTIADATSSTVLFVSRYFYPFIGGMEKQALTVAAALVEKGWRVEVITCRVRSSWPAREELQNVSITRLPSLPLKYIGATIFLISLVVYLYKKRSSYEIIHAFQVGYTGAVAMMMAKALKKASVLKLACSGEGGDVQRNRRSWVGRLFLAGCKKAGAAIALNEEAQQEFISIGYPAEHVCALPNGVDTAVYCPVENRAALRQSLDMPDGKIIVYTGRILFVQKRLDWLVKAISKINCSQPFRLYIIGEGPDAALLRRICEQLSLNEKVRIVNNVDNIAPFLQAADVFILPSEYEGISNSVLEAMASGLAVIATDIPGNRELIEDGGTGVLVPCGIEEKLISALESLIVDDAKAAYLGRNAREKVCRHYAVKTVAQKYGELYDRLIKGQAA